MLSHYLCCSDRKGVGRRTTGIVITVIDQHINSRGQDAGLQEKTSRCLLVNEHHMHCGIIRGLIHINNHDCLPGLNSQI